MSTEEREALGRLEKAAERWLEARAAGRSTTRADQAVAAETRAFRRAERRRRQAEKRAR